MQPPETQPREPVVVWVTSHFPHGHGEQFIEGEIAHWIDAGVRVVVMPEKTGGTPARPLPAGIELDLTLAESWTDRRARARAVARAARGPLGVELLDLGRGRRLSSPRARAAVQTAVQAELVAAALATVAERLGRPVDLVYSYWMSVGAIGGALARRRGDVRTVVCRSHNIDLYENIRPHAYKPMIRRVTRSIDKVFPISQDGVDYLVRQYGFRPEQVECRRLGVAIPPPDEFARPSRPGELSVLSVSTLTRLKRVDRIIDALGEVAGRHRDLAITWHHAGAGPLHDELHERAERVRAEHPNLTIDWLGQLSHDELLQWYADHAVDLLVNTSESEGIPVSIMEAKARRVPALATDVGGVREVVDPASGWLMPADAEAHDVAEAIDQHLDDARTEMVRGEARELVTERFDADANFAAFVAELVALAGGRR